MNRIINSMDVQSLNNIFGIIILPLLIFTVRIIDVSIGTVRIIFVSKDIRLLSAVLGFFEVLIWLFAISQIMRNLNSPIHYIAYASGFAIGNYVGISIERKFSYGNRIIQVITSMDATALIKALKRSKYSVTSVNGIGAVGPVKIIFTVVKRSKLVNVIKLVKDFNPNAFYTVEDVKFVQDKYLYPEGHRAVGILRSLFQHRK